jgi:hypothetical protein
MPTTPYANPFTRIETIPAIQPPTPGVSAIRKIDDGHSERIK